MIIKENQLGGVDLFNEKEKFLLHLNDDDLKAIYNIKQMHFDVDTVRNRVPDWVQENTEQDDYFLADFNSIVFSDDETSVDEITAKILSDNNLICKIAADYRESDNHGADWWHSLNKAFAKNVSISQVLGEILYEKHPKEFYIGQWCVRIIEKGDLYGRSNRVPWKLDEPLVEFYDMNVDRNEFPDGQFTSGRYRLSSLLNPRLFEPSVEDKAKNGVGLCLSNVVPEWTVKPGELNVICTWLHAVQNHLDPFKGQDSKYLYRGDVDVPFDILNNYRGEHPDERGANVIKDRLSVSQTMVDNISIEKCGEYDNGYGYSVSFVVNVDKDYAESYVKYALQGLKHELWSEPLIDSLDKTLAYAQERSRQEIGEEGKGKNDFDVGLEQK